jgi:hypothetical protein
MKKVAELEPGELDYWVARAKGLNAKMVPVRPKNDAVVCKVTLHLENRKTPKKMYYTPSWRWEIAGPIIEQHGCSITAVPEGGWSAYDDSTGKWFWGESILVAAMRAFVASKFGELVPDGI